MKPISTYFVLPLCVCVLTGPAALDGAETPAPSAAESAPSASPTGGAMSRDIVLAALEARVFAATGTAGSPSERAALEADLLAELRPDRPIEARQAALRMLGHLGAETSVAALAECLRDTDPRLRDEARQALARHPSATAGRRLLRELDPVGSKVSVRGPRGARRFSPVSAHAAVTVREVAGLIDALVYRREITAAPAIAGYLQAEPPLADVAALALGRLGGESALAVLRDALDESGASVRASRRALETASLLAGENDAARLAALARTGANPAVRAGAFQRLLERDRTAALEISEAVLADAGSKDAEVFLKTVADSASPETHARVLAWFPRLSARQRAVVYAAWAARREGSVEPLLLDRVAVADDEERVYLLRALGAVGTVRSHPVVVASLMSEDNSVRHSAQVALARFRTSELDAWLASRLRNDTGAERLAVLRAVAICPTPEARARLETMVLKEPVGAEWQAALDALEANGDVGTCALLARELVSTEDAARRRALQRGLKRLAANVQRPEETWRIAFAPALDSAAGAERGARIVSLLGVAQTPATLERLRACLVEPPAPVLREAARRALAEWTVLDAGPVWLAYANVPSPSDDEIADITRNLSRLITSPHVDATPASRLELTRRVMKGTLPAESRHQLVDAVADAVDLDVEERRTLLKAMAADSVVGEHAQRRCADLDKPKRSV